MASHLLSAESLEKVEGLGTGRLATMSPRSGNGGGNFFLSGMSAKARGYDETLLEGHPAKFAMPDVLVKLAIEADTVLCY